MKKLIIQLIILLIFFWIGATSLFYWTMNPDKTQMEVFLHIPKSMLFIFHDGEE